MKTRSAAAELSCTCRIYFIAGEAMQRIICLYFPFLDMCMNSLRLFQTSYGSGGFLGAWRIKVLLFRIADFSILIFTFRDDKIQPPNDPLSCLSSVFINLQTRQPIKCMEEETMAPNQMCAFTRWSKTNCTRGERFSTFRLKISSCFIEIKLKWIKQH